MRINLPENSRKLAQVWDCLIGSAKIYLGLITKVHYKLYNIRRNVLNAVSGDEIYSPTLLQISSLLGLELAYPSSTALLLLHNQLALHEHQQLQQQQPILRQCLTQSVPSAPPTSHTLHHPAPMESKPVVPATHLALILEKALMSHYHHHQQEKCEDDKSYACTTPRQGFPHIQGNGRSMTVMGFSGDHVTPEEIQERTKAAATTVPLVSPSSIPHWSPSATVEHGGPGVGSRLDRLPSSSSDHHHYNHPQQLQQHHHPSLGLDLRRPRPPPPPSLRTQQNISSCSSMTKVKGQHSIFPFLRENELTPRGCCNLS